MASAKIAALGPFTATRGEKVDSDIAERVVLMCASALFAGLDARDVWRIASCARIRSFARDEMLFMQGQPVQNLVLLQEGSVKMTQLSSGGNEVILWMNGQGDAVGVHGNHRECQHTCSARAIENCRALTWEYARLQEILVAYPQIRSNISGILASRLHELEERFREVATEKVARRLALTLLRLLKQIGKKREDGVEVCLSREELAQMTGTTLFTISRILSKWSDEGVVIRRREAVTVCDVKRLEEAGEEDF